MPKIFMIFKLYLHQIWKLADQTSDIDNMKSHLSQPSIGPSKPPKRLRVDPPDLDTLIEDSQQDAAIREVRSCLKVLTP